MVDRDGLELRVVDGGKPRALGLGRHVAAIDQMRMVDAAEGTILEQLLERPLGAEEAVLLGHDHLLADRLGSRQHLRRLGDGRRKGLFDHHREAGIEAGHRLAGMQTVRAHDERRICLDLAQRLAEVAHIGAIAAQDGLRLIEVLLLGLDQPDAGGIRIVLDELCPVATADAGTDLKDADRHE